MLFELALGAYAANAVKSWWKSDGSLSSDSSSGGCAAKTYETIAEERAWAARVAANKAKHAAARQEVVRQEVACEWEREMARRGWRDLTKTFRC